MKQDEFRNQEELERLDAYLDGNITEEERAAIERELAADPQMREELEMLKLLREGVSSSVMREHMDEYHAEMISDPDPGTRPLKIKSFYWSVAAVLIVVLGVYSILNLGSSNEKLFTAYFSPDPGLPTTMSSTSNYEFFEGMVDYKQENYLKAIQKWESIAETTTPTDTLNYFIGVAYLASMDGKKSIPFLKNVSTDGSSVFQSESNYYLGLAHLKEGDMEMAKEAFQRSEEEKASLILKEIDDQ